MKTSVAEVVQDPLRVAALHELGLLDTPAEQAFDRLSQLAARILQTPVALVSLVDSDRQFFKSCLGLPEPWSRWRETPLSHSFCQHVVASGQPLVIPDARRDPHLLDNLAIRDLNVVAYLGSPLILPGGQVIGSFCVIDTKPRAWTDKDISIVRDLAASVMTEIQLRSLRDGLERQLSDQYGALLASEDRYRDLVESSFDLICTHDFQGRLLSVNRRGAEGLGYDAKTLVGRNLRELLVPEFVREFDGYLERVQREGSASGFMQVLTRAGARRIWSYHNTVRTEGLKAPVVRGTAHDVTEQIGMARELRASEARFRATFEQAAVGIAHVAPDGRFLRVNQKYADILGYSQAELLTKSFQDITHPASLESDLAQVAKLLAGEIPNFIKEKRYIRKDGSIFWANLTVTLVRQPDGTPDYLMAVVEDITARYQVEEALRARETQLSVIHDNAYDVIFAIGVEPNDHFRFTSVNRRFMEVTGLREDQILGKLVTEVIPQPAHALVLGKYKEAIRNRQPAHWEETSAYPAGNKVAEVTVAPVFDANGNCTQLIGAARDITERKEAQEKLRESELRARTVSDSSPVGIFMAAPDGHIVYDNVAIRRTLGYKPEEVLLDHWAEAVHPDDRDRVFTAWSQFASGEQPDYDIEFRFVLPDQAVRMVHARAARIFDGERLLGFAGTAEDITEHKRAIDELMTRNVEMENFVYTISHDLKAPLITIGGFASLLKRDLAKNDLKTARDSLAEIEKATGQMTNLIQDLLMLSRIGRVKIEKIPIHLGELIDAVLQEFSPRISEFQAKIHVATDMPAIKADAKGLRRVFSNLVDNALKYRRADVAPDIEIGTKRTDGAIQLFVRDNGAGIRAKYHKQIFELFQRADSTIEGTGVGLPIARRVIEDHGGRLWVESESGQGSTFWIELPADLLVEP